MKHLALTAAFLAAAMSATAAQATTIVDPIGDFAPGYLGAAADLDVTSFSVRYDASAGNFLLDATFAGVINPATAGVYIIGVNTGTGTLAPFASIGAPNVRFNQTVRVNKDGTGVVGVNPISVALSGNSFSAIVSASLLTSTGFAMSQYSWNLWPRTGVGAGTLVTDFAPDNAMLTAAVPEPASWAMMIGGFAGIGGMLRRRRNPVAAVA